MSEDAIPNAAPRAGLQLKQILPGALLSLLILSADQWIWAVAAGLSLVVWVLSVALAIHLLMGRAARPRKAALAWVILIIALLPAVEVVQALSLGFALLGLTAFAAIMLLPEWEAGPLLMVMRRLPLSGLAQTWRDARSVRVPAPSATSLGDMLRDWLFPLGIGVIFLALLGRANPILDGWFADLVAFDLRISWDIARMIFWAVIALFAWPLLRLQQMRVPLMRPARSWPRLRTGLVNPRSTLRALLLFNAIFAVQTLLDASYLWGGASLPDGMTYAAYAHRGAYPLLVVALMAGAFALMVQPFGAERPMLRALLYLWIGQTVLLVLSSILRLDLYVEAYGLTRLRFAAFVWMVVTALGLLLMIMQMLARRGIEWFAPHAAGLGLIALYAVSLVNVDGFIARHNLAVGKVDAFYLCNLSEGALPATTADDRLRCHLEVSRPDDWREWGFRNARLRRSLAAMKEVQG